MLKIIIGTAIGCFVAMVGIGAIGMAIVRKKNKDWIAENIMPTLNEEVEKDFEESLRVFGYAGNSNDTVSEKTE